MADLPTVFAESAATRIGAATRWAELQQGIPQDGYGSSPGNGLCLVRTRTTLPAGYTGAMAALGDVIEKQPDGTVTVIGTAWIKDQNGGTLSPNTIYQARIGGTWTQDVTTNTIVTPTTLGLYLVQMPVVKKQPNYYPSILALSNDRRFYVPGNGTGAYFIFGPNAVFYMYGLHMVSNIVRDGGGLDAIVYPQLKIIDTEYTVKFNNITYQIFNGYSDPIWVDGALKIEVASGAFPKASNSFTGKSYNTPVDDPGNIATSGKTGLYLCQWTLDNKFANNSAFGDRLIVVSKQQTQTTGGIGSGIGSGISGV